MFFKKNPRENDFSNAKANKETVDIQPMDMLTYFYDKTMPFLDKMSGGRISVELSGALPPKTVGNHEDFVMIPLNKRDKALLSGWVKINCGKRVWGKLPGIVGKNVEDLMDDDVDDLCVKLAKKIVESKKEKIILYCALEMWSDDLKSDNIIRLYW